MVFFLLCGCSNDENETTVTDTTDIQLIALNASSVTNDADIMLLGKDGSHLLCDFENEDGYGVILINGSLENDVSDGIMTLIDQDGKPVMTSCNDYRIIYDNVLENSFDCAIIDKSGEVFYYWDVYINDMLTRALTTESHDTKMYNPLTSTWQTIKNFDWTWDEHQKQAILPALAKFASFALTASSFKTPFGGASIIYTYISEAKKSDGENINDFVKNAAFIEDALDIGKVWKSGEVGFNSLKKLGILSNALNDWADQEFEKMGHYEEYVRPTFESKEWQIKLGTNLIKCGTEEKEYRVNVATKAAWEIDDANVDKSWCSVYKDGNQVIVKVKAYNGVATRTCFAKLKTKVYNEQIHPALLTIQQDGVVFDLSESNLTFTQEGGFKGVYVYTNDNITSWEVSAPTWCKITKGVNSFFVDINKSDIDREGVIEVAGMLKDSGSYITKQIVVKQICNSYWNGTSWNFSGNVNVTGSGNIVGGFNMADIANFGIQIIDVANNKFSLSGDLAGMEYYSNISLDEQGRLILNLSQNISVTGCSVINTLKIIFEQTEHTKSIGKLTGKTNAKTNIPGTGNVNVKIEFNGTFNGTLLDESK